MDTLLGIALIGIFMTAVTTLHVHLTARPPEPVPVRPISTPSSSASSTANGSGTSANPGSGRTVPRTGRPLTAIAS